MGPNERLLQQRLVAYDCFIQSNKEIEPAVELFNSRCPQHGNSTPSRFIRDAYTLLTTTYSLHSPRTQGRKRAISDDVAAAAVQLLWDGYQSEGQQCFYTSIEAACEGSQRLAAVVAEHRCTPRTLLAAMKRVEPGCRRRLEVTKRPHSPESRRQRVQCCKQLGSWSIDRLLRTCWIDAATIWVAPKDRLVYAPPDAKLVRSDDRHPSHSSKAFKLRFYICINALLGPVSLRFITGTTDLDNGGYEVGNACCWLLGRYRGAGSARVIPPAAQADRRQNKKQTLLLAACCTAG